MKLKHSFLFQMRKLISTKYFSHIQQTNLISTYKVSHNDNNNKINKQAGTELGQAQVKLESLKRLMLSLALAEN